MAILPMLFLAAMVPQEADALRWKPKKGEQFEYLLTAKLTGEEPMQVEAQMVQKVTAVTADGYTVESWSKGTLVRMPDEEIRDQRENRQSSTFGLRGEIRKLGGGERPGQWAYAVSRSFVAPPNAVKVGDGWQHEYSAIGSYEGSRLSYQYVKREKGLATVEVRVNGVGRDRPEIGQGTWTIDVKTGHWISMKGWVIGIAPGGIKAEIELKRG
jgi:hypothetical protein